jgi:hypothetical protein
VSQVCLRSCVLAKKINSAGGVAMYRRLFFLLLWVPLFGAGIKKFIYDSNKYLFGCHVIGYGIHLEFHSFYHMSNLNTYQVPCHLCGFAKIK